MKVKKLEKYLGNENNTLKLECMRYELNMKYERICKINNYKPDESDEEKEKTDDTALTMSFQKFKARCHNCGNYGNKR